MAAGNAALELGGGAFGDDPALVEHGDPVGEPVGLVEVLGGEEDRDAVGDQLADDLPHGAAAARIQPGGRLVQEDQPRIADERHRQVQAAAHPPRVGRQRLVGRVGEVEPLEQLSHPSAPRVAAEVAQVGHQAQVLGAGEQVVHRGELAGDPDRRAHRRPPRLRTSCPATRISPASAAIRVDRMRTIVVLPAPLGPSSEKIVPSATVRSTWSSTRCSPNDLSTPRATIAGVAGPLVILHRPFGSGEVDRLGAGRRRGAPDGARSTPARAAGSRSTRKSANAANSSSTARRSSGGIGEHLQAFAGELALLPVLRDVEPPRASGGSIDADPVHPLPGGTRPADQSQVLQRADRAGDRAAAGQERLGQLADALLRWPAHHQVAQQPAHHRRHPVAPGVQTPGVIGERDLSIRWHGGAYQRSRR